MQATHVTKSSVASIFEFLGIGRRAATGGIVYLALFAVLWLSEGLTSATFAATVLLALGLAVRVVVGLCGILDQARKGQFDRLNFRVTILSVGALAATALLADLPMETITKASVAIGVIVFVAATYAFRH